MTSRRRPRDRGIARGLVLLLGLALAACGDSGSGPDGDDEPDPGPGPHYSVVPIELEKLARVTPVGTNGKILPIGHTYWYTCDTEWIMPTDRPCVRERLPIRSPVDGVVWFVEHEADGEITIRGPEGLYAGFAHVTPTAELERGDRVEAGDTIARMHYDFAFDFGMTNYGVETRQFINPARYAILDAYLHTQNPIAQYPEPLRSELIARVRTQGDPLGEVLFDVPGTAAGGWFLEGTPVDETFTPAYAHAQLFLGPLQERPDIRIVSQEAGWFSALLDIGIVGPEAPRWEDLTPASGRVWLPLWEVARDGGPNPEKPKGGVLVEVLANERLTIEWFDGHEEPVDFTAGASTYVR